jgi:CelD/BcsL family acetyltransferase involved in cellulose biosynthesis
MQSDIVRISDPTSRTISVNHTAIDDYALGWEALALEHGTLPTQDVPWALASLDAYGGHPALFPQGARDTPNAIAPMTRRGDRIHLNGDEMFEPGDLLADSAAARAALAAALVRDGVPLELGRVSPDSPTIDALRDAVGVRGVVLVRSGNPHPVIHLDERWQEPGGGLSSSRRSALRRSRRRAERSGEISVEMLSPPPDGLGPLLDEAFAVEARSWKGRAGTALAQDTLRGQFVRRYAEETAARGTLRLQFLRIGGVAVAMHVAVEWRRTLWLVKIGYDDAYAAGSPGQLLMAESIADAARRGLERFQMLGNSEEWTRVWTTDEEQSAKVCAYPATPRGSIGLVTDGLGFVRAEARRRAAVAMRSVEQRLRERRPVGVAGEA